MIATNQLSSQSIVIIGAGIIGVCSAIEFAELGYRVELIDKNPIAVNCCSVGNTGHIGSDVFPLSQPNLIKSIPKLLLKQDSGLSIPSKTLPYTYSWLIRFIQSAYGLSFKNSTQALSYLAKRCIDDMENLFNRANIGSDIQKSGCLFLYQNQKEFDKSLAQWAAKEKMGFDFKVIEQNKLNQFEPHIKKEKFAYGILTQHWAKVSDPKTTLIQLFDYAKKIGVQFNQAELKKIESTSAPSQLKISLLKQDKLIQKKVSKVLIAGGIGCLKIAQQLKEKLPIIAERGYAITYPKADFELKYPILMKTKGVSVTSLTSGFRLGGWAEITTSTHKANDKIYQQLQKIAKTYFKLNKDNNLVNKWMNSRPATFDSIPILSPSLKLKNLYYATGHGHCGLSFSATSAKIMADLVSAKKKNLAKEYDLFSLHRFN